MVAEVAFGVRYAKLIDGAREICRADFLLQNSLFWVLTRSELEPKPKFAIATDTLSNCIVFAVAWCEEFERYHRGSVLELALPKIIRLRLPREKTAAAAVVAHNGSRAVPPGRSPTQGVLIPQVMGATP